MPPDYVLGPGDSIRVQLFGNVNGIYEYEVSREGVLHLPEIGPVTVAGLSFSEFRTDLNKPWFRCCQRAGDYDRSAIS